MLHVCVGCIDGFVWYMCVGRFGAYMYEQFQVWDVIHVKVDTCAGAYKYTHNLRNLVCTQICEDQYSMCHTCTNAYSEVTDTCPP